MKFTHECGGYFLPFFAIAHRNASNPRRRFPVIWPWCVISKRRIDKSHLKRFLGEHEIYCIFIKLYIGMTSTLENFSHERQILVYIASSIPWMQMTWQIKEPGYRHPLHLLIFSDCCGLSTRGINFRIDLAWNQQQRKTTQILNNKKCQNHIYVKWEY